MVRTLAPLATAVAVALVGLALLRAERTGVARPRDRSRGAVPGLDVPAVQFWATVLGVALLTFMMVYAFTGLVVVSAAPALVVATLPRAYFVHKRALRLAGVQEAWPDGLRDLVSSVKSGASLPSAIESMATYGPEPLRQAFGGFGVYARSLGVVPALEMVKEDISDPTSDRIIEVLILAYQRGGCCGPRDPLRSRRGDHQGPLDHGAGPHRHPGAADQLADRLRAPLDRAGGDDLPVGGLSGLLLHRSGGHGGADRRGDEPGGDRHLLAAGYPARRAPGVRGWVVSLGVGPLQMLAALLSGVVVLLLALRIVPPPRRLGDRVQPYVSPTLVAMSRPSSPGVLGSIFGPMVRDLADWLGGLLDRAGAEVTTIKLKQAGWFRGLDDQEMVTAYRITQLKTLAVAAAATVAAGVVLGASPGMRLALVVLGLVVGISRTRGRLDKAVDERRERMRVEVYTVNQLLAMRVRAGGGVIQAVSATTQRGRGEVVAELEDALRLHRAGWSGPEAFRRIAELTPEPFCSRTYRLLASAEERGSDLAGALLSLSEDVRETRRESVRRTATKRRAAMLIPTVVILAPVLILFVAAPLPYLITSWQ